ALPALRRMRRVPGLLPGLHPTAERARVREPPAAILRCQTGRRGLRRSCTEEDDLLALRQRRHARFEVGERDAPLEAERAAFRLVGIATDEQPPARRHVTARLVHSDSNVVRHVVLLSVPIPARGREDNAAISWSGSSIEGIGAGARVST